MSNYPFSNWGNLSTYLNSSSSSFQNFLTIMKGSLLLQNLLGSYQVLAGSGIIVGTDGTHFDLALLAHAIPPELASGDYDDVYEIFVEDCAKKLLELMTGVTTVERDNLIRELAPS